MLTQIRDKLSNSGWTSQVIGGVAVTMIMYPVGMLMNSNKLSVYGAAFGVTIIVWVVAYHIVQAITQPSSIAPSNVALGASPETTPSAPPPINVQGSSGPIIITQGQLGGQTALTINNYSPPSRKADEKAIQGLVQSLRGRSAERFEIEVVSGDVEATALGHQLSSALQDSGWQIETFATSQFPVPIAGLTISAPKNSGSVKIFYSWCQNVGMNPSFKELQINKVHVLIGTRQ